MEIENILKRLKSAEDQKEEVYKILEEYKGLKMAGKVKILSQIIKEKRKSENSDILFPLSVMVDGIKNIR